MAANYREPAGRLTPVRNQLSGTAKESIVAVFTRLGGTAAMATWAEANPTEFYRMYARLLPTDLQSGGRTIEIIITDPTVGTEGYTRDRRPPAGSL